MGVKSDICPGSTHLNSPHSSQFSELAIHGGSKAVHGDLPNWPPRWPSVMESLQHAWSTGSWGEYQGSPLQQFRSAFADFLNIRHVWCCASGTISVELALRGLGVMAGDEVIMAGYDFPGNFRAIEAIGARPVLVDVKSGGFVLEAEQIREGITEKTKAVIVSHLHGQLAPIPEIAKDLKARSIGILEDACQVPGAVLEGKKVGTWGDVGTFSFGGSKLLTSGRGGAVVTNSDAILQRIKIAAERGNDAYPLSPLQAAALVPQLISLTELHQQRLQAARKLKDILQTTELFQPLADEWSELNSPAFYKFPVLIPPHHDREFLMEALTAEGVPVFTGFRGFAKRSKRRCDQLGSLTNSRHASEKTILLHHPFLLGGNPLIEEIGVAFQKVAACY